MAEENKIKISEMSVVATMSGSEAFPIEVGGSNYKVYASLLREYFKDSNLLLFDEFEDGSVTLLDGTASEEDGADTAIVFLTQRNVFALRKTIAGYEPSYYAGFLGSENYASDGTVRTDKVFFCLADKELYSYNGALVSIFESIRIHAMTEEEFENLTNPIEGAFYATYED